MCRLAVEAFYFRCLGHLSEGVADYNDEARDTVEGGLRP